MKWLKVNDYAKQVGKTRQQIYLDIRLGKIKDWKKVKANEVILVKYSGNNATLAKPIKAKSIKEE